MRNRYKLKRSMTKARNELSTYSREDLESVAEFHVLFMDDVPKWERHSFFFRKNLARQLLNSACATA